jgi:hypothetical protein
MNKRRLSASVDARLIEAIERAVARAGSGTVSGWVNEALRFKLEHDRRLAALAEFVATYEAGHGEITDEELRSAARGARSRAITARGLPGPTRRRARGRRPQ